MIEKLTVLETYNPKLDGVLPRGHVIDTDYPIVFAVGENGSGKTAFLRMLNASLLNAVYFRTRGTSKMADFIKIKKLFATTKDEKYTNIINEHPELADYGLLGEVDWITGAGSFEEGIKTLRKAKLCYPELDYEESRDIVEIREKIPAETWVLPSEEEFDILCKKVVDLTKRKVGSFLEQRELEGERWELERSFRAPYEIWKRINESAYLSPQSPKYFSYKELQKYSPRPEIFDEKYLIDQQLLERLKEQFESLSKTVTDRSVWGYFSPNTENRLYTIDCSPPASFEKFDDHEYLVYDMLGGLFLSAERKNWGKRAADVTEDLFAKIDDFFLNTRIERRFYLERDMQEILFNTLRYYAYFSNKPFAIEVPQDSQLVVFLDEPTAALSYRNRYRFMDRLVETAQKYSPRLQFFVATNDAVMIEHGPQDAFIDFDAEPVTRVSSYRELRSFAQK